MQYTESSQLRTIKRTILDRLADKEGFPSDDPFDIEMFLLGYVDVASTGLAYDETSEIVPFIRIELGIEEKG